MFKVQEKYTMVQIVELIGTDKQKEQMATKGKLQTKSKEALLKELATMVKFEETKEGRKNYYLITEIFEEQQEKEDGRKENGREMEIAELGLLKYLARREEDEQIPHTRRYLSLYAGLCNEKFNNFVLSKKTENITYEMIQMEQIWYQNTRNEIKNRLDKALNSLKNKGLIHIEKDIITVKTKEDSNYTVATRRQKSLVVKAEKEVMDQLNIKKKNTIYLRKGLREKFYKAVYEILEKDGIVSYYYGVDIIQAPNYYIEKEINILEERLKVNSKFIDLYQSKIEKAENQDLFGDEFICNKKDLKYKYEYKEMSKELNDKYIKIA